MIKDLGARVASLWEGLRPATRSMVVGALQGVGGVSSPARGAMSYDARADWELSRLLAALDERIAESDASLDAEQSQEIRRMADTCAEVLKNQTQSAEVFVQLVQRAHSQSDFARIDSLADALSLRFAPSEVCELVRCPNPVIRALAHEALAQAPTSVLIALLGDPVDANIARDALERQADEYGVEEAREIVRALDQSDSVDNDT